MSERADYYIEKVKYSKDHTRIIRVSVREDSGAKLGKAHDMVRKQLVDLLQQGKQFMAIYRNEEGKYRKGQKIALAKVDGAEFIRSDQTQANNDQIDNVPEY